MMNRLLKNEYVFSVLTKILMVFVGFAHSVAIARFLGAELKGIMSSTQSIVNILAIIITFGVHEAYPFYRKKYGNTNFLNSYMSYICVLHIIYMIIGIILSFFFTSAGIVEVFACICAPISGYAIVSGYVCLVEYPRNRNAAFLSISILETIFAGILLFVTDSNYFWLFVLLVFSDLLKSVYFTYKLHFNFSLKYIHKELIVELLKFGFFPMLALLLTSLNYKIDIIMLNMSRNITMAQIGVYSIGVALADKTVYIPDAVKEILLSKLAKGKKEEEVARATRMCFPISIIMVIAIFMVGAPLIDFLYGSEYSGAFSVTVICVFGTAVMVFFKMIAQYNVVNKKQIINVIMLSVSVLVNIVLNILLIPKYGIIGAAIASIIGYFICAIVFVVYFSKVSSIPIREIVFLTKDDLTLIKNVVNKNRKENKL